MKHLLFLGMTIAVCNISLARNCWDEDFDWSKHITDWEKFQANYQKYDDEKYSYTSATNKAAVVSSRIDKIREAKTVDLKIGEFEEEDDFRARVEQQRKKEERLKRGEIQPLEKQLQQYMNEAKLKLKAMNELALWLSSFTNRVHTAKHQIKGKDLPYFDRDLLSFKDVCNPFYAAEGVSRSDRVGKIKFVVNPKSTDFNSAYMPDNYHVWKGNYIWDSNVEIDRANLSRYDRFSSFDYMNIRDSYKYWERKTRAKSFFEKAKSVINIDVAEAISLKFKNLSDAGKFKSGISSGTINAWICCEFRVGMPAKWIVSQGQYKEEVKRSKAAGLLNAIQYGDYDERYRTDRAIWHSAVIGKIIPISIISNIVIIEGDGAKSIDVEVVSPTGTWALEKRAK